MAAAQAVRAQRIPEWKVKEVKELTELAKKYRTIVLVDLTRVPTAQLQKLKKKLAKKLGDKAVMRVAKNTLFKIALRNAGIDPTPLEEYLTGTNMFIFTELNPYEVALILDKTYTTAPAKPGAVTETEIVIPAGDTGFKPGPIMSVFGKLKIPIRVQGGTIWVAKDSTVAKPGDTISPELASVLQKLGIEPLIVKLKPKVAYDEGVVIPGDQLRLDLGEYRSNVASAHMTALMLGVELGYPEPQVMEIALPIAARRALALAIEAGYVTDETAEYVIRAAIARVYAVIASLGDTAKELGIEPVSVPAVEEKPQKEESKEESAEEEEKKEASEEDLAAGLESLFGM